MNVPLTQPPQRLSHWPAWSPPPGLKLVDFEADGCPYLSGRRMRLRAMLGAWVDGPMYQRMLDSGFRRAGSMFYQPICAGCRACVPVRVDAMRFRPSRSQRRCLRRNADLSFAFAPPDPTDEKYALYAAYQRARHEDEPQGFGDFALSLYAGVTDMIELTIRDGAGALVGVGLSDVTHAAVSSVYFYYDTSERHARRGLGTFSSLLEIDHTRRSGRRYYYLGYYVAGCAKMRYKSRYGASEQLDTDGVWRAMRGK